ncbi:DUF4349 domain-containing protein [Microbacterium sp. RD1]|uniref:DUF4349 domain-containing protein n=1 Tax=Microbacterium sp. RD1 TaxID=3457313 RepID=UPI003FA60DC6
MNTTQPPTLPELDDVRIAAIERDVFGRIAEDRRSSRRRRARGWAIGASAAAVIVVAAVIAPSVTSSLGGASSAGDSAPTTPEGGVELAPQVPLDGRAGAGAEADSAVGAADAATGQRDVISTGSATVVVGDVAAAAEQVAQRAQARGGYVESLSIGSSGDVAVGGSPESGMIVGPAPYPGTGAGWVSVRVPADQLDDAIAELREIGEVTSSTVSRQDVTDQAIDVRARIAASEASVARLTELMAQAADVADLLAAETALSERQATLEADRQQLAWLEGQIDLSSLSVQLVPASSPVEADPAGFGDGVAAGWNGLVATLNGIVIAFGFLLPWLGVLAVAAAITWGVVALLRRIRRSRRTRTTPPPE